MAALFGTSYAGLSSIGVFGFDATLSDATVAEA
jgi:hypothetical protein